jgi:single-strand DNA-binding protein
MADLNHCEFIGRLGANPEVRVIGEGQTVALFSLATNQHWRDRTTGERKQRTEWIRVEAWGSTAQLAERLLTKGREIWLVGRLKTHSWMTEGGEKRFATVVVCQRFQLLGPKPPLATGGEANDDTDDELLSEGPPPEDEEIPF